MIIYTTILWIPLKSHDIPSLIHVHGSICTKEPRTSWPSLSTPQLLGAIQSASTDGLTMSLALQELNQFQGTTRRKVLANGNALCKATCISQNLSSQGVTVQIHSLHNLNCNTRILCCAPTNSNKNNSKTWPKHLFSWLLDVTWCYLNLSYVSLAFFSSSKLPSHDQHPQVPFKGSQPMESDHNFPSRISQQPVPSFTQCDDLWLDVAGCGWMWLDVVSSDSSDRSLGQV